MLGILAAVVATAAGAWAADGACSATGWIDRNDGNRNFANGSTLEAGFAVRVLAPHPALVVTVDGTATFRTRCRGEDGTVTIQLAGTYSIPSDDAGWYPSGDQADRAAYQGRVTLPECGADGVSIGHPGSTETFRFTVSADQGATVEVKWHYRGTRKGNGRLTPGAWSGSTALSLLCAPSVPAIDVACVASEAEAHVGDVIGYSYTVTNAGTVPLAGVHLADSRLGTIPLGETGLAPGESTTGSAEYAVGAQDLPGPLESTATASGVTPSGEVVTDTSPSMIVALASSLSLQVVSGSTVAFPPILGPGEYHAEGGTVLRVTSDRLGWALSQGLSFSLPPGAEVATVERAFEVSYSPYEAGAGSTDVVAGYTLVVTTGDLGGLPQGDYLITVTYTVTSGG